MGLPEIVDHARKISVLVRVSGPDPKGLKMRGHAFHRYHSRKTTLSASGLLLPDNLLDLQVAKGLHCERDKSPVLVLTVASVVEPFLALEHREKSPQGRPQLISGVHIDVMADKGEEDSQNGGAPSCLPAQLLSFIELPTSSLSLHSLIEASLGSLEHGLEAGWSMSSSNNGSQPHGGVLHSEGYVAKKGYSSISLMSKSATRIAVLGLSSFFKDVPVISVSPMNKRGDFLLAVGSPFGVLSPSHFFNSISVGSIANCYPRNSLEKSLLMADIRSLPGMEGSPTFSENMNLIGILIRQLRQKTSGAEIQVFNLASKMIFCELSKVNYSFKTLALAPWEPIVNASGGLLRLGYKNAGNSLCHKITKPNNVDIDSITKSQNLDGSPRTGNESLNSSSASQKPLDKAMASVCLITIDEGVWASGVLLNNKGLILTNAHLLEPWRFGKTHVSGGRYETSAKSEGYTSFEHGGLSCNQETHILQSKRLSIDSFVADESTSYKLSVPSQSHRRIHVRLDHIEPWIWCDAKVLYVCKGPWDIALLQIECVPNQLSPIVVNFRRPSLGCKAYVIGHGLFGSRFDFFPFVSSGVVSKVVEANVPIYHQSSVHTNSGEHFPVMLETTAAVHPGTSGGAVVNSDGHMIGLVTRHGGGTVTPHLNFSLPSIVLEPVIEFSKGMQDLPLVQCLDEPNEHLSSVWRLMPPLSPKPPPLPDLSHMLQDDAHKEQKGSRFAEFIAERKETLEGQPQTRLGKMGRLANEVICSKL